MPLHALQEIRVTTLPIARAATSRAEVKKKKKLKRYLPSAAANQYFAELCRKVRNIAPLCDNVQTPEENTVTIVGQGQ